MFDRILVPIDVQEMQFAREAIEAALEQLNPASTELHVATVLPGFGLPLVASYFPAEAQKEVKRQTEAQLRAYVQPLLPDQVAMQLSIGSGSPHEEILKLVQKHHIELVVMHSHNRQGLTRVFLGSCANRIVEHAQCSVLVLRNLPQH